VPDNGIVSVYPSQISILNQLMVNEDDYVHINSALFKLQIEQGTNETAFTSDQILETLNAQESVLNETKVQEELFIKNIMAS
jgi:hypothetical protein